MILLTPTSAVSISAVKATEIFSDLNLAPGFGRLEIAGENR